MIREILKILSDDEILIISEKKYLKVINKYLNYLIRIAKSIKRELLLIAMLASNFYNDINRKLIELKIVISFFILIFNNNIK